MDDFSRSYRLYYCYKLCSSRWPFIVIIKTAVIDLNEAFKYAAWKGHLLVVKKLDELGATNYQEALVSAAEFGHLSVVDYLLSKIRYLDSLVVVNNLDIFRLLVNYVPGEKYQEWLQLTAFDGQLLIFRELLQLGTDPRDPKVMQGASVSRRLNIIWQLINLGIDYRPYIHVMGSELNDYLRTHLPEI